MTCIIKVSDLLVSGGKSDMVSYTDLHIDSFSQYMPNTGLSGEIFFQPIPLGIVLTFRSWKGEFFFVSEYSGKQFKKDFFIPEYQVVFLKDFSPASDNAYDTEFPIDLQRGEIDVSLPIEQFFRLQFPIVFYAPGEQEILTDDE